MGNKNVGYVIEDQVKSKAYISKTQISENDFTRENVIGIGAFGKVVLVKKKSNSKLYAMKIIKKEMLKDKADLACVTTERLLLKGIDSPFIVRLRAAFQNTDKLFLIMKYYPGGNLEHHLSRSKDKKFSENRVKLYAIQLIEAISYLHDQNIIHRDVKLKNILLDEFGHIILADFGLSTLLKSRKKKLKEKLGTWDYLAYVLLFRNLIFIYINRPEMMSNSKYDRMIDYWALGICIYEMIVGVTPFDAISTLGVEYKVLNETVEFPDDLKISDNCKDFIRKILDKDPTKRLGINKKEDCFNHPWLKNEQIDAIIKKNVIHEFIPHIDKPSDIKHFRSNSVEKVRLISPKSPRNVKGVYKKRNKSFITVKNFYMDSIKNINSPDSPTNIKNKKKLGFPTSRSFGKLKDELEK